MFAIDHRDNVEFDEFGGAGKCSELLKQSLSLFDDDIKDSLFNSVLYGIQFKLTENNSFKRGHRNHTRKEIFAKISESKKLLQLDDSL